MGKRLTQDEFIEKAKKVHGNIYDYTNTVYIKHSKPVKIFCKKCKCYFEQTANNHLAGKGCPICGKLKGRPPSLTLAQFIEKAKSIHGEEFDYSQVQYINNYTKVKIFCKHCQQYFWQAPNNHLNGSKCNKCKAERLSMRNAKSKEDFIQEANILHQNRYDYSEIIYKNAMTKIKIFCKTCKKYFWQSPVHHLLGCGCSHCCSSKGELVIENFLVNNTISYQKEKRFIDCKDKKALPFDFYLPDYNICIEFQGKQHYIPVMHFDHRGGFDVRVKHDQIKKEYCKVHNITLLEIRYDQDPIKVLSDYFS